MGEGAPERGGYRVPAPERDACVVWPDDFGTRFTIFVDTEEEFDWGAPLRADADGTGHLAALPPVHARFAAAGVPLTYLIDYPVASSPLAMDVLGGLMADGRSAIGTQLHPWVNPPFEEEVSGFNSFTGNLPLALQRAKLVALTDQVTRAFGKRPVVYRAGRYGIGRDTPALLAELGYRLDSSMRSGYDYSAEGGPDFGAVPNQAFRLPGGVVELPFTTVFTGRLRAHGAALHRRLGRLPRGIGVAARLGLLSRVSLTPEDMPLHEAKEAVRVALGEGVRLLNFAFHSPSVEPGHTPYVKTQADLAAFLRWWDEMLALLNKLGARPASVDEIVRAIG
ncbi:polysaccharide deacetylase family protein [Sphingomonas sp. HITSZ_GF]|uniref:polysaccharide deacetylase family protein n=1 Tax=Sphingomonas sp. HITSZ_GF TaxID=3037247 RepID=UPI00240D0FAF|nr:polysaccharide deacetylase family protein [Sphingomonas sp. HITSZ_GF]MDG2532631.1 polysaccharide deacetylase family protein [Sphingomonas sp. HITSZ_GF]